MPVQELPPGWATNPSAWPKRVALAALALAGLIISTYLTLYQVKLIGSVWDPAFPSGSPAVLSWTKPVPDAAFGVGAYAAEIVLSFIGNTGRWRSRPWPPVAFGAVAAIGAVTSVILMISQPVAVGHWCTLCLASAGISLVVFAWGIDEPLAALQHVARVSSSRRSLWRALRGGRTGSLERQPSAAR
jgi:hypothetical protein